MPELPTGTATFLFSDVEGSTRLLQRLGPDYARVLGEHQALLRAAWADHGGAEVDTQGDSFFAAFPAAPEAVAAAAQATSALAEHAWPEGAAVRVRIGLHTGTPTQAGDGYVGLDVHRAARIAAAGHGGQILLSEATRVLAEHNLPDGATLRDLGAHRLKDLQHAERLYQLALPGLPADFPPLKSLDARPHNLPVQPTPLLGREVSLAAVGALLRREDVRLVTLTGPGGIGKTRLSIRVAAEAIEDFADGVWFVGLSRLTDPGLVVPTIAQTLGLRETGSQPISTTLRAYLRDRRLLLVLDNFEQVVGAAGEVAGLLGAAPGLTVLATSRVALRLRGERRVAVPPLALAAPGPAPDPARLAQYAAVALFIQRAQEARADFQVTVANAPGIAEICARLDGLPLAIELAAARVAVLPPEALLGRLSTRLKLLTGGARDLEERQRTMRAAIAWSEDLLSTEERTLFRRLAVFVGGCTLEAAEVVCAAPEGAESLGLDVLDGLGTLVDHSLVQQRGEDGEPRFAMLHVVREYALERLEASGEVDALHRAQAAYFLALAERAEPKLAGPEQEAWLGRLTGEHDNLRAALSWARDRGEAAIGLRCATAIWRYWHVRGYLSEGRSWLDSLLATGDGRLKRQAVPMGVRARALEAAGMMAGRQGDYGPATACLEEGLACAREAGDRLTEADTLIDMGVVAFLHGDLGRAETYWEASVPIARELGSPHLISRARVNLSAIAVARGDLDLAHMLCEQALALDRQVGDQWGMAGAAENLATIARLQGDLDRSMARSREALALYRRLGTPLLIPMVLEELAAAAGVGGRGITAARLLGAAATLRATLGTPQPPHETDNTDRAVAPARATLGEERWAAAFVAGRALSLDEAIAEALAEDS